MSIQPGQRPRRFSGTPVPESSERLRPEDILRGTLIAAVIIVCGYFLGQFTFNQINGRGTAYFVLAAALGVLLTAVAYQRLELVMAGFMAVGWMAIGNTPGIAHGMTNGGGKGLGLSQIGIAFLLILWAVRGVARGQFSFIRSPLNGWFIAYIAYCVLSDFNATMYWDPSVAHLWGPALNGGREPLPVYLLEVGMRVLLIGVFWLFANNLKDEVWLRRITWMLLLPGIGIFLSYTLRLPIASNHYALLLVGGLASLLFAWLIEPHAPDIPNQTGRRALGWLALLLMVAFISRNMLSWVSIGLDTFVGLYFVAFMRSKRLFLVMLVGGLFAYVASHAILEATVIHKVETSGDLLRFSMARAAVMYALKFPLGVGPGNYRSYNAYFGSAAVWNTSTFSSAHDMYGQMLSELGFGGFLITLGWVLTALWMMARFYRQMRPGWSRTFTLGIGGIWAGMSAASALGDYLIPVYHNGGIATMATAMYAWIALGIGFAHGRRAGLVTDAAPVTQPAASDLPNAADFYPRRMGHESSR